MSSKRGVRTHAGRDGTVSVLNENKTPTERGPMDFQAVT